MQSLSVDPNHMSSRSEDSADFGKLIQPQASSGALLAKENFNFSQINSPFLVSSICYAFLCSLP